MERLLRKRLIAAGVLVIATLACAAQAQAAFPGGNGKLVFSGYEPGCSPCEPNLYIANPDGSGRIRLLNMPGFETNPRWSPDGAEVAYGANRAGNTDVYKIGASGAGVEHRITTDAAADHSPAWTPDGTRFVFVSNRAGTNDLWSMNVDGTAATQLTSGPDSDGSPAVSPDGTRVAFTRSDSACTFECPVDMYVMDIDGSDVTEVPIADPGWYCAWRGPKKLQPDWSPSGDRIVFAWNADADCEYELDWIPSAIETIRPDGSGQTMLRYYSELDVVQAYDPVWSPDGTRVVFAICCQTGEQLTAIDADGGGNEEILFEDEGSMPDWQPLLLPPPRPRGASPLRVSLVPAFQACTAANREHGPPLAHPSCAPPDAISSNLTVGVGDGSPAFARSIGWLRMTTIAGPQGGPDDSDVKLRAQVTNVMNASDLSEYTGELRARLVLRITDRDNGPSPSPPTGWAAATVVDTPFAFSVPCTPTPGSAIDASTCAINTTADSVMPGVVKEGKRTMWALDRVQVFDGGADGDGDTESDNELFEVQGVFVP